ncbi:hypothetical protein Hypma_007066 [Hypsizygus marmoreus]|uniref:F-box domain-containing protein n=1 Tax=Hypsizygus marmoreus TaxID=39966 RepID=A0A369KAA1_HYPMA|nr:hypothetical protein Hypma_007066 [Hypsizygus marmoreus]
MVNVPQEIVDTIVEAIPTDHSMLKTCALVSSSFRYPAQKRLYKSVQLEFSQDTARHVYHGAALTPLQLHNILAANPVLGKHVKHLSVLLPWSDGEGLLVNLDMLPCVCKFSMTRSQFGDPFRHGNAHWSSLSAHLRNDIYNIIRSPQVVDISISNIDAFSAPFLTTCAQLKSINLEYVTHTNSTDFLVDVPPTSARRGGLEVLRLMRIADPRSFIDYFSAPLSILDISHLREYHTIMYNNVQDTAEFQTLSEPFARSLEKLSFEFSHNYGSRRMEPGDFDLTNMQNLRILELTSDDSVVEMHDWLEAFIYIALPENNVLQTLSFTLPYDYHSDMGWREIDTLLYNSFALAKTQVKFRFSPYFNSTKEGTDPELDEILEQDMPYLLERGAVLTWKKSLLYLTIPEDLNDWEYGEEF